MLDDEHSLDLKGYFGFIAGWNNTLTCEKGESRGSIKANNINHLIR